ncbi:hypothetical protein L0156_20930, partial [bacterium]|nr:hypothetical protein [bacterium]
STSVGSYFATAVISPKYGLRLLQLPLSEIPCPLLQGYIGNSIEFSWIRSFRAKLAQEFSLRRKHFDFVAATMQTG